MSSGWKSLTVPYPGIREKVADRFAELFVRAGCPTDRALFSRADFTDLMAEPTLTYLVSPEASDWIMRLSGGKWEDDPAAPYDQSWSMLIGTTGDPKGQFGIRMKGDDA